MEIRAWAIAGLLLVAGVIHLLPVVGVLGAERLTSLYGVPIQEPNLVLLLRHRAVLFGLLGALLVASAFRPALQPLALVAGLVSAVSFLVLARLEGPYNGAIARVVTADVVAVVCLAVAGALVVLRGR